MLAKSSLLSGRKLRRPRKPERCAIEFAYSAPKSHEHAAVEGENVYAVVISMHKNNVSILEFGDNIGIGSFPSFPCVRTVIITSGDYGGTWLSLPINSIEYFDRYAVYSYQ
jgi:hypothetical protein